MSSNLIQIKTFLGKYYSEIWDSLSQPKYIKTHLAALLDQKFSIQTNKTQMLVDPNMAGLSIVFSGNEVHISQTMFDHEHINITNSMEHPELIKANPKSLYNADTFSTIAYLVCQNHTILHIVGEIDEPIYIRYETEFETFYNSVVIVNIEDNLEVEVVEEFNSKSAMNSVTNYMVGEYSKLMLSTFYQNLMSASSVCLRNAVLQPNSTYSHMLFGKGSANTIDESKIIAFDNSSVELLGCINPGQQQFHTIVGLQPAGISYNFFLDHRHIISGNGVTTFTPVILGTLPKTAYANIKPLMLDTIDVDDHADSISKFISNIIERSTLERNLGSSRFYKNKAKFLQF